MAQRRMLSKEILEEQKFRQLSPLAKTYYMYAVVFADDDGVVDMQLLMDKLQDSSITALKSLVDSGYLARLGTGRDMMAYVCRWTEFNVIAPTKYHRSPYHDLLVQKGLITDKAEKVIADT